MRLAPTSLSSSLAGNFLGVKGASRFPDRRQACWSGWRRASPGTALLCPLGGHGERGDSRGSGGRERSGCPPRPLPASAPPALPKRGPPLGFIHPLQVLNGLPFPSSRGGKGFCLPQCLPQPLWTQKSPPRRGEGRGVNH